MDFAQDDPLAAQEPVEDRTGVFATTHWSVVLAAHQTNLTRASAALERLCRTYWSPIYAFVRRRGSDPHEAENLTQAFFASVLEKEAFWKANRAKGMFRTKVWSKPSGAVVYDNQPGASDGADPSTAISGGSVIVHAQ